MCWRSLVPLWRDVPQALRKCWLLRKRGEFLERPFAHAYETGGLRRVYLRGHCNILKRLLIHLAALNLGLLMRVLFGVGTPRSLQGRLWALCSRLLIPWRRLVTLYLSRWYTWAAPPPVVIMTPAVLLSNRVLSKTIFTTGC